MATTVIIPCRNEEATIGAIVRVFNAHPETAGRVYVGIDDATVDDTPGQVWNAGGFAYHTGKRGKGQVVRTLLDFISVTGKLSDRIVLCDGDYTGLELTHISAITNKASLGMVIGVPDWPEIEIPGHVRTAWPWVSGFRCLPWNLIPADAHGYMLETQLNKAAIAEGQNISMLPMVGLKSPFQWPLSPERQRALERDRVWGRANGILPS